jgi:hypothetical protein
MDLSMDSQLRALERNLVGGNSQNQNRPPVQQRVAAQTLATDAARSSQRAAADRLSKLGDSLAEHWKEVCAAAVSGSERVASCLDEAESTFRSALIVLERASNLLREEEERVTRLVAEAKEKAQRIIERCEAIERDITPERQD